MVPRFCFSNSITDKTCRPCSLEQFRSLLLDPRVQDICDQIKLLDGRDPEEMARLKRQLPIITPHAQRFHDDRRRADGAIPSGLVMLDVDHIDDPRATWQEIKARIDSLPFVKEGCPQGGMDVLGVSLAVALVAITPSGHGLRIIAERKVLLSPEGEPEGAEPIDVAQQRLAAAFGFPEYDACTKDLSRASFVMPMSYVLYMDDRLLEFPDEAAAEAAATPLLPPASSPQRVEGSTSPANSTSPAMRGLGGVPGLGEVSYHGHPYRDIISQIISLLGGTPEYGERNTFYFTLVRYARYICDFNPELLLSVLPDFGLSEPERRSVIASAVNRPRKSQMPDLITRALALTEAASDSASPAMRGPGGVLGLGDVPLPPLPRPLEIICNRLPESFRPAMIIAALPVLGTLATGIRFRYLDRAEHSFSFMSCITAPAATGKSFIRRPVNLLLTPIDEQDEIEREKEQDYKDALRASKNTKQQPENPRACPRNNGISISIAKLLQLLSYSDGKHLIGIGEEIDTLVKSERAGVWSQKSDIYRLGFDNAKYGQNYMSDSSFSANVPVYYNLLLTGTPGGMYRFFKDVEDGLVTRFCFAQLPDMFASEMPDFQDYTPAEEAEVIRFARMLDMAEGTITCPAVDAVISAWLEEKRKLAIESDSRAIDTLRRRSAVIGFRAGYLAALINGETRRKRRVSRRKKEEAAEDGAASAAFARWVAEYVFLNQMQLFGSQFEKVADEYQASVSSRGRVRKLLQSLPATFTKSDLMTLRARSGQNTDVSYVLTRWKQNGLIEELSPGSFRKIPIA